MSTSSRRVSCEIRLCVVLHSVCHCLSGSLKASARAEQAAELGSAAERLDKRCTRFVKGSRRYRDGIGTTSGSQTDFTEALREFCGGADGTGTDEESMSIGEGGTFPLLAPTETGPRCLAAGKAQRQGCGCPLQARGLCRASLGSSRTWASRRSCSGPRRVPQLPAVHAARRNACRSSIRRRADLLHLWGQRACLGRAAGLTRLQVDHLLVDQLHNSWHKLLAGVREAASQLRSRTEEYDEAQKRFLGHR